MAGFPRDCLFAAMSTLIPPALQAKTESFPRGPFASGVYVSYAVRDTLMVSRLLVSPRSEISFILLYAAPQAHC